MGNSINGNNASELAHYVYDKLERSMKDWFNTGKFQIASTWDVGFIIYSSGISLYPIIPFSKYSASMLKSYSRLAADKTMIGFLGLNFYTPKDQTCNSTELNF